MDPQRTIPGIDEPLPEGEAVLWTGAPSLAVHLRHGSLPRVVGAWFLVAAAVVAFGAGGGAPTAHLAWVGLVAVVSLVLVAAVGWLVVRTTTYAITDRRVVMRIGIALPAVLNIPVSSLSGAGARKHRDGSGDIDLALVDSGGIGYALLWPHARPWRFRVPVPALRWLPDVAVAANALQAAALVHGGFDFAPDGEVGPAGVPSARRPDRPNRRRGVRETALRA
jgi:hypothetical protein